ncbi:MAG: hypothetical protein ACI4DR_01545 [Roseburia sp.]
MEGREYTVTIDVFPNGVNRVYAPILTPEEEEERHKRLHDAAVKLLRAQMLAHMEQGETV